MVSCIFTPSKKLKEYLIIFPKLLLLLSGISESRFFSWRVREIIFSSARQEFCKIYIEVMIKINRIAFLS